MLTVYTIIKMSVHADFTMRTSARSIGNARYYASNPFYKSGYGMPNCTCRLTL